MASRLLGALHRRLVDGWTFECDWCGEEHDVVDRPIPPEVATVAAFGDSYVFEFCSHECTLAWRGAGEPIQYGRVGTVEDVRRESCNGVERERRVR